RPTGIPRNRTSTCRRWRPAPNSAVGEPEPRWSDPASTVRVTSIDLSTSRRRPRRTGGCTSATDSPTTANRSRFPKTGRCSSPCGGSPRRERPPSRRSPPQAPRGGMPQEDVDERIGLLADLFLLGDDADGRDRPPVLTQGDGHAVTA